MRLLHIVLFLGLAAGAASAEPIVYTSIESVRYNYATSMDGEQSISLRVVGDDSVIGQRREFIASVEVPLDDKIRWILNQCKAAANKVLAKPSKFDLGIETPFENPADITTSISLRGPEPESRQSLVCTLLPAVP